MPKQRNPSTPAIVPKLNQFSMHAYECTQRERERTLLCILCVHNPNVCMCARNQSRHFAPCDSTAARRCQCAISNSSVLTTCVRPLRLDSPGKDATWSFVAAASGDSQTVSCLRVRNISKLDPSSHVLTCSRALDSPC